MRIIDADALEKTIAEEFHGISATEFIRFMRDKTPIEVYNRVRDLIDNAPPVNIPNYGGQVVPDALQGWRYEEKPKGEWIGGEIGHCSNCGSEGCASDIWNGCKDGMYCPNCGVEMKNNGGKI